MEWVKMNIRKPESFRTPIIRYVHTKQPILDFESLLKERPNSLFEITEWLDEQAAQPPVDKSKIVLKVKSMSDLKENIVAILTLMGDPNLTTKEDVQEIDNAAMEIYEYLTEQAAPPGDGGWVDCNERLPDYNQLVLVYGTKKQISPQMGGYKFEVFTASRFDLNNKSMMRDKERYVDKNDFRYCEEITHWRELPPPPSK